MRSKLSRAIHPIDNKMLKPYTLRETPTEAPTGKISGQTTVLYLPFLRMPNHPEEMIDRLSLASGIHQGDMRYKIVGSGINRLTPVLPPEKQRDFVAEMQTMGIPAVIVAEQMIKRRIKLPIACSVEITDSDLCFFDRNKNPVFRIDKETDLLIIAAELTGKRSRKSLIPPDLAQQFTGPSFTDALRKISLNSPAAIFYRVGDGETVDGVLMDHSSFHYRSMNEYMQMSAAANFRTLIEKAINYSKTCITDNGFSSTTLARISHDENSSKRDILTSLGRYSGYMLAAAESGLITPESKMAADYSYTPPHPDNDADTYDDDRNTAGEPVPPGQANRLNPPPPLQHSGIIARLFATPYEFLYAVFFLLIPFFSIYLQTWDLNHPVFWKTLTTVSLLGAGLVMFPYGLLILTYKRMVENTPTSKVRSMAMGMVEVSGQARQYYDLKTSHSGTQCVYFRCRYFRRKGARFTGRAAFLRYMARDSERWVLEREISSGRLPFYIEDETGRVLVRPSGALFLISKCIQQFSGPFGMWMSSSIQRSDSKIHEDLIAEGARVYVLGKARPEKVGPAISEKISKALQALKKDKKSLMKYDTNNDGRVDLDEWETARKDTENRVYAEMLANGGLQEQIVIGKPGYGMLPLIIADSEEGIIRKLGFRVWTFLAGGMLMIVTAVHLLTQRV